MSKNDNGKARHEIIPITPEEKRAYATAEEATKNRPARRASWKLYPVTDPKGVTRFVWAGYRDTAVKWVAEADGYSVGDPGETATKEKVAGLLASLSAEDRAALLAQFGGKRPAKAKAGATATGEANAAPGVE
jgi:hypothetical protein